MHLQSYTITLLLRSGGHLRERMIEKKRDVGPFAKGMGMNAPTAAPEEMLDAVRRPTCAPASQSRPANTRDNHEIQVQNAARGTFPNGCGQERPNSISLEMLAAFQRSTCAPASQSRPVKHIGRIPRSGEREPLASKYNKLYAPKQRFDICRASRCSLTLSDAYLKNGCTTLTGPDLKTIACETP